MNLVAGDSGQTVFAQTVAGGTTGTDWLLRITDTEKMQARVFDDSADAYIGAQDP